MTFLPTSIIRRLSNPKINILDMILYADPLLHAGHNNKASGNTLLIIIIIILSGVILVLLIMLILYAIKRKCVPKKTSESRIQEPIYDDIPQCNREEILVERNIAYDIMAT